MCDTCGCGDHEKVSVEVGQRILSANDERAAHNREHFARHHVLAVNVMGSPGAGKTALLEATARHLRHAGRAKVLAGDLATENDARRLRAAGLEAVTINTGTTCHLDARMVHAALHGLSLDGVDFVFVENVGNLVCPAVYDLGQGANVVVTAVTEGEDKPLKYPVMFRKADLVVLSKTDLLPHLEFDLAAFEDALGHVMPEPRVLHVAARRDLGLDAFCGWLASQRLKLAAQGPGCEAPVPGGTLGRA